MDGSIPSIARNGLIIERICHIVSTGTFLEQNAKSMHPRLTNANCWLADSHHVVTLNLGRSTGGSNESAPAESQQLIGMASPAVNPWLLWESVVSPVSCWGSTCFGWLLEDDHP